MMRHKIRFFLALLSILLLFTSCETRTIIANNVNEREANEIVVLLAKHGLDPAKVLAPAATGGGKTQEMWNVTVPGNQIVDALAILNQAGLPRTKGTSLLDLFGTQGLVPSDLQDRIRYQEGLSEQLAITIRKMDGIIDASVQITFPQEDEPHQTLTASVYIKHRGILDNPNSLIVTKIKRLVASAIPGLSPDNVSVITDRALYTDIMPPSERMEEELDYVSIWGIMIAKESSSRFRLVFYTFLIFLFVFACFIVWILWKLLPLLKKEGTVKFLIHPEQYNPELVEEEEKEKEAPEE